MAYKNIDDEHPRSEHLMTVLEVTDLLNVSRSSVYQLMQRGELASLRIGRLLRFRREQVEAYITRREQALKEQAEAAEKQRASARKKTK